MSLLTKAEIDTLGVFLVAELHASLIAAGKFSNIEGLASSIKFETKVSEGFTELVVYAADYAQFVDQGVKGRKSSARAPKSPFKFRKKFPAEAMLESMQEWIRTKAISTGDEDLRNVAFAMSMAILRDGIKPSNFIENALKKAQEEINKKVEQMAIQKTEIEVDRIVKRANK